MARRRWGRAADACVLPCRTASEIKVKRAQGGASDETAQLTDEAFRFAIGMDMGSDTTHEAANRALSTVARKLDKTLSVEYTVNELIAEATDVANLALMFAGACPVNLLPSSA